MRPFYPSSYTPFKVCVPFFALVLALCGTISPVQAQDGHALLLQLGKTYRNFNSLENVSTFTSRISSGQTTVKEAYLTVTMRYAKPNKFFLNITRNTGSIQAYCDGTTLYTYDVSRNFYAKDPAPKTMPEVLQRLFGRLGVVANLDPLYFLVYPELPKQLVNLKFAGYKPLDGASCAVVTGQIKRAARTVKNAQGVSVSLPAEVDNWTWWIDRNGSLLRKVETRNPAMSLIVMQRQGKTQQPRVVKVEQLSRHVISTVKPNAPLSPDAFRFSPPAGATLKLDNLGKK